ncbi:MAG: hypothetical protein ACAF42_12565 [Limnothrix sp. BL-A-16]
MSNSQQSSGIWVGLAVIVWLASFFVISVIDKLNAINPDLSKSLVSAGTPIVIALISVMIAKLWEQRLQKQQEIRMKKMPVYEKQIKDILKIILAEKYGDTIPEQSAIEKGFLDFTQELIVWGSPEVIQAWSSFKTYDWSSSSPKDSLLRLEEFMLVIRKDLGNNNSILKKGDLVKLFINDFHELDME